MSCSTKGTIFARKETDSHAFPFTSLRDKEGTWSQRKDSAVGTIHGQPHLLKRLLAALLFCPMESVDVVTFGPGGGQSHVSGVRASFLMVKLLNVKEKK